jgi:hypothetical protein
MKIEDKDLAELRRIQESIPKDLQDRLIMKRAVTPTMAKVLSLLLREKGITKERKAQLQAVKDSGLLAQTEDVVNQSVQKQIDKYVTEEIEKSILAGRLTKRPCQ